MADISNAAHFHFPKGKTFGTQMNCLYKECRIAVHPLSVVGLSAGFALLRHESGILQFRCENVDLFHTRTARPESRP